METNMIKTEHNVETGEIIETPLTTKEIAEIEKQIALAVEETAKRKNEEDAKTASKAALLAKLDITEEEGKLLLF
jgi:uncharacterized small protein (DUF1192 family)